MTIASSIEQKLSKAFSPKNLEVINESHLHAGHNHGGNSFDGAGETHFRIRIHADEFKGKSRLAMHRAINECLAQELAGPVHALAIEAHAG